MRNRETRRRPSPLLQLASRVFVLALFQFSAGAEEQNERATGGQQLGPHLSATPLRGARRLMGPAACPASRGAEERTGDEPCSWTEPMGKSALLCLFVVLLSPACLSQQQQPEAGAAAAHGGRVWRARPFVEQAAAMFSRSLSSDPHSAYVSNYTNAARAFAIQVVCPHQRWACTPGITLQIADLELRGVRFPNPEGGRALAPGSVQPSLIPCARCVCAAGQHSARGGNPPSGDCDFWQVSTPHPSRGARS
jgi:hypothetical protein